VTIALTNEYTVRAPTPADMDAVVALLLACDMADFGEAEAHEPDEVQRWWAKETTWLVHTQTGELIAYVSLDDANQEHVRFYTSILVQPERRAQGLELALLDLLEHTARQLAQHAPPAARPIITQGISGRDTMQRDLLLARDFAYLRTFWTMRIDQTEPPPAPEWPAGITLRTYQPGQDDRAVYDVVEEAFHDHWDFQPTPFEEWLERTTRPAFDPALWFLALDGEQIAGATLCTNEAQRGWINKVAVRRPWRKRGLALALVRHALGAFWARGVRRVELGVDAASITNAQKVYERAGMHPIMEYVIYEKSLAGS
jgi:mycothiol synthase